MSETSPSWGALLIIGFVALVVLKVLFGRRACSAKTTVFGTGAFLGVAALFGLSMIYHIRSRSVIVHLPAPMDIATNAGPHQPAPPPRRIQPARVIVESKLAQAAAQATKEESTPLPENTGTKTPQIAAEITDTIPADIAAAAEVSSRPRPKWVDEPPHRENGAWVTKVKAGPQASLELCLKQLPSELTRATNDYIDGLVGMEEGAGERTKLPLRYIQEHIVVDEWTGPFESEDFRLQGMVEHFALLRFDEAAKNEIHRRYQEATIQTRLEYTGATTGLVLLLLGTLFGYLKLDTATKGYYSGRLKLAATATILAGSAATAIFVKSIAT